MGSAGSLVVKVAANGVNATLAFREHDVQGRMAAETLAFHLDPFVDFWTIGGIRKQNAKRFMDVDEVDDALDLVIVFVHNSDSIAHRIQGASLGLIIPSQELCLF